MKYKIGDLINIKTACTGIKNGNYIVIKIKKENSKTFYTLQNNSIPEMKTFGISEAIAKLETKLVAHTKLGKLLYS